MEEYVWLTRKLTTNIFTVQIKNMQNDYIGVYIIIPKYTMILRVYSKKIPLICGLYSILDKVE